jgi:Uri superfamily endonuclease
LIGREEEEIIFQEINYFEDGSYWYIGSNEQMGFVGRNPCFQ